MKPASTLTPAADTIRSLAPQPEETAKPIHITELRESPLNPRTIYDATALAELAQSIKHAGIQQPLIVRPHPSETGKFEIVAGSRRRRASEAAHLEWLPCIIRKYSDADMLDAMDIENGKRKDLDPIEEGTHYAARCRTEHISAAQLAKRIDSTKENVLARMKLATCGPTVAAALRAGHFGPSIAVLLARRSPQLQEILLAEILAREEHNPMTVKELARHIPHVAFTDLRTAPFGLNTANLIAGDNDTASPAGPCIQCPKHSANDPELRAEAGNDHTCGDRICYLKKTSSLIHYRTALIFGRTNKTPALLSTLTWADQAAPKGALHAGMWRPAGKRKCPHTHTGLIVHTGYDSPKRIGEEIEICAAPSCPIHPNPSPRIPPRHAAKPDPARKVRELVNRKVRAWLWTARLPDLQSFLSGQILRLKLTQKELATAGTPAKEAAHTYTRKATPAKPKRTQKRAAKPTPQTKKGGKQ